MEQRERISQDERWQRWYDALMGFYKENHRRPSKHRPDERLRFNWLHQQKKLYASGRLNPDRIERFMRLLTIDEKYRRKNQWG